jgi:hypothetical protein
VLAIVLLSPYPIPSLVAVCLGIALLSLHLWRHRALPEATTHLATD